MSFLFADETIDGKLYFPVGNGRYAVAGIDRSAPQQRLIVTPGSIRAPRKGGSPYLVFSITGEQEVDLNVGTDEEVRAMARVVTQGFIHPDIPTATVYDLAVHLTKAMNGSALDNVPLDTIIRGGS